MSAFLRLPVAGVSSLGCSQLAYRTTQACPLGTRPLPTRDLSAPAPEKAAAYFRRYTVVTVYYARYRLVQLAFAELSPYSSYIPFHSLAECRNRHTSRLQRSLASSLKTRVLPRTRMAIANDPRNSAHALKGLTTHEMMLYSCS